MKNIFKTLVFIIAATFVLSSCSKDEPIPEPIPAGSTQATLKDGFYVTKDLKFKVIGDNASVAGFFQENTVADIPVKITIKVNDELKECVVVSIAANAFKDCTYLEKVNIPSTVTSIGTSAFEGSGLTSVNVPKGQIGKKAFMNCAKLASATLGDDVKAISDEVFADCVELKSIKFGQSITSIGSNSFYNCSSLTSVTIPNSVTSIGSGAFSDCVGLKNVTIPNSVKSIARGELASFTGCKNIESLNIDSEASADISCFPDSKESLKTLVIGESIKAIAKSAFYDCTGLESVTIPNTVSSIGTSAFEGCGLTSVNVPKGQIGSKAFMNCVKLTNVTLGNDVTTVGDEAFSGCSELATVKFGQSITSIGKSCFVNTVLTEINIPSGIIGEEAFSHLSRLKKVTFGDGVTKIGAKAFYYGSVEEVHFGNSVKEIGAWAFAYSYNHGTQKYSLLEIYLPNSLEVIGENAFHSAGLQKVVVGTGIKRIKGRAFYLDPMETFIFKATTPPVEFDLNFETLATAPLKIYVPDESFDAYAAAIGYINGYPGRNYLAKLSTYTGNY